MDEEAEKEALVSGEHYLLTPKIKFQPFTSNKRGNYRFKTSKMGDEDIEVDIQKNDRE